MKLIELHILQSFPVSCLNRDDVGAPKSATFGGVSRARISSQCLKRAIREYAEDQQLTGAKFTGKRTKRLAEWIAKELTEQNGIESERALAMACAVAGALNKKEGKALDPKDPEMETLFYASPMQVKELARLAIKEWGLDKKIDGGKDAFRKKCSEIGVYDAADIALFGRMVAADPSLTLEGAAMFSHALSTHKTENDLDFFSAVDDRKPKSDDAGAGMIGTLEFNSAVYYRYAAVNLDLLFDADHLEKLTPDERKAVVAAFIHATVLAVPGARKNSMNASVPPSYVLGTYKEKGQPVQLINAFELPVPTKGAGLVEGSIAALKEHHAKLKTTWGIETATEAAIPDVPLAQFIETLTAHVA